MNIVIYVVLIMHLILFYFNKITLNYTFIHEYFAIKLLYL